MRQTACDVCRKTHPDVEPIGWILVGIVMPATTQAAGILAVFGQGGTRTHELKTFTLCSADCLRTFAELESVSPEQ